MILGLDTTFLVQCDIREHPGHQMARDFLLARIDKGDIFAMAPQTAAEYLHIVTDPKRFRRPLTMDAALRKADIWWSAAETRRVYPDEETIVLFQNWMQKRKLGRKRILDTLLAATFYANGIRTIVSSNARDFASYEVFNVIDPASVPGP
jgi:predicted nucleic acid-binding protein